MVCGGRDAFAGAGRAPLRTAAELKALALQDYNVEPPLALSGIVTLADPARNMFVVQDDTGAIALHPSPKGVLNVRLGQRVSLEASACAPYVINCPDYPFAPLGHDILPRLEALDNRSRSRLTRVRGWLRPPTTGRYTFWIASDDSSELWLSPGANPAEARRIATVKSGDWTNPREWNRFPAQRSDSQTLEAEKLYYLEVLQEQQGGTNLFAVSWKGPGIDQAVIGGEFLTPWSASPAGAPPGSAIGGGHGVLREYWDHYGAAKLTPITGVSPVESGLTTQELKVSVLDENVWPQPRPVDLEQDLPPENVFRWVEGEGTLSFFARDGESATLELAAGPWRPQVRVSRWQGKPPDLSRPLRARFRGVCEGGRDLNGHLLTTLIIAPTDKDVEISAAPTSAQNSAAARFPAPARSALGGLYFTRGVVTFSGNVLGRERIYVQEAWAGISISMPGPSVSTPLQVGQEVEIGGNLLPGKYAPGIRPYATTILGWQSMPVPRVLSSQDQAASYRDGLWMELEGVARYVEGNGTLVIKGRQDPLLVWVGQTPRGKLESLVNARLRVRGVMSLDTLATPVLLVPSANFVEVLEPAPVLPAQPQPLSGLKDAAPGNGWVRQARVAGTVTGLGGRDFFLQDASGAVRVQNRLTSMPLVGGALEATGFPEKDGTATRLTDATWRPRQAGPGVKPAGLDLHRLDLAANGTLATIEAQLLSQKVQDTDRILELRSGEHVFEAVMAHPAGRLAELADGSTLRVTGVCLLEAAETHGPAVAPAGFSPATLARLLLRDPGDVILLQGPPWWTWQRAVYLIGALLAVLSATLMRVLYFSRRLARQQAARLAFTREMLKIQESERRRIAASLHDSLGQDLLVIRNQANRALQSEVDGAGLRHWLEDLSGATLQAINAVREITHNLQPYQLDRLGLTQAIRALTRKVSENSTVVFACLVDDIDGIFDKDSEIHLYRIIQEGLSNIIKHSGATEATILVKRNPANLSISIRDNGCGLPAASASSATGLGLSSISERASMLHGTAKVESQPGQGVNLQIEIPLSVIGQ